MPDALMKTVPIWCAVFNRLLFAGDVEAGQLYTPSKCVSRSEHAQIEQQLDGFVSELKKLQLDIAELRAKVSKPLRPFWVTVESQLPATPQTYEDFYPIVLCTASRRVKGGEVSEGGYIQGAGDDAEGWSHGLTPGLFWQYEDELLATSEEELPGLITSYLQTSQQGIPNANFIKIKNVPWLSVGSFDSLNSDSTTAFDTIISVGQRTFLPEFQLPTNKHLHLECRERKLGSRDLRTQLSQLRPFIERLHSIESILVCDSTGQDLAVGISLALLCLYTGEAGKSGDDVLYSNC
jgi:tRNA A64-2'-O-ribosylphosphate transferase